MKRISLSLCAALLLACGVGGTLGCGKGNQPPQRDKNGRTPKDVVMLFLAAAKARDHETGKRLWYGEYQEIMKGHPLPSFAEYCDRYAVIEKYTLKGPYGVEGDRQYRTVVFEGWTAAGEHDGNLFALKVIEGEWKINRSMNW